MPKVVIVQYQTHPEAADENQRLIEEVMSELDDQDPGGLRYASFRLDDGVTFVHVAITEGDSDPLSQSTAFTAFQQGFGERHVTGTRARSTASVVGSYRFFGQAASARHSTPQ
ncbi:hypothetical protein LWP59_16850 [Amycolatopsis acidiphila]|uniref:Antibiotic biosynthesis monooxygenase n=1 Tax=Amycolatopsis acidiphila TaxID=715473 RepID=A0A558AB42_9PSEU|nr:hypothetical protein [Amycolatopsis acidiphila]TVT21491.1 hypothetical protein FNH06_17125 [Amycolatopsis acidiphila]UIJ63176.1 hypothetical protein LWP59_16850 [Amycolatopsis acidiphila]GHG74200.1 hypothetical protein GCM10017788_37930 [Amycolatopsis acidiphila]